MLSFSSISLQGLVSLCVYWLLGEKHLVVRAAPLFGQALLVDSECSVMGLFRLEVWCWLRRPAAHKVTRDPVA